MKQKGFNVGQIVAVLKSADSCFAVIDRVEPVQVQQFGQLACIDAVVLVPGFQQGVLARITDQHLREVGLEKIVQPSGAGFFFKGHVHPFIMC